MLIFWLYEGERISLDVSHGMTVKEVREMIQSMLNISVDQYKHDKKVLVLSWAGSDLQDPWVFSDLGVVPGTTIRVNLKQEVKPVLFIHCSHSQDTLRVYDNLAIGLMQLADLRTLASHKTGLPVSIFRLVSESGQEMYDGHRLEDYGVDFGHTISLQNLDGWNEFLNLAVMGFTPQVISQLAHNEVTGRYQMKVALFLAAHFGHVDLARVMLRHGVRASEPIGYPPQRMWCTSAGHVESRKAAVHKAVEMGQLGVLRLFVNNDITVITSLNGEELTPLQIALRHKIRNCASFLLTKQWSKINITKNLALRVGTYTNLRQWCERAKERAFIKYGHSKSSLKRRPFQAGPLVGFGVTVDGYSPSIMTGKSKAQLLREQRHRNKLTVSKQTASQVSEAELDGSSEDPETYFKHMCAVQNLKSMGGQIKAHKAGRVLSRVASKASLLVNVVSSSRSPMKSEAKTQRGPEVATTTGHDNCTASHLPAITFKPGHGCLNTQSTVSIASTSSDTKELRQQPVNCLPALLIAGSKKKDEKSMMSALIKVHGNAFFLPRGTAPPSQDHGSIPASKGWRGVADAESQSDTTTAKMRSGDESLDNISSDTVATGTERVQLPLKESAVDTTSTADSAAAALWSQNSSHRNSTVTLPPRRKKRRGRVTSALLLSKAKSSEGTVPLPLISNEQDRRPFFYFNGKRDDVFISPTMSTWYNHTSNAGSTPRERAIQSLMVADSFKEKPWLGRLQIALKITANPTKRNVRRLRSAERRTLAVQ